MNTMAGGSGVSTAKPLLSAAMLICLVMGAGCDVGAATEQQLAAREREGVNKGIAIGEERGMKRGFEAARPSGSNAASSMGLGAAWFSLILGTAMCIAMIWLGLIRSDYSGLTVATNIVEIATGFLLSVIAHDRVLGGLLRNLLYLPRPSSLLESGQVLFYVGLAVISALAAVDRFMLRPNGLVRHGIVLALGGFILYSTVEIICLIAKIPGLAGYLAYDLLHAVAWGEAVFLT